ncbi:MAG: hypothetical protein NXI23_24665 [Bacteroidetes bacterium]|nr:hypothetical protein [Bacteroidota bacterium]
MEIDASAETVNFTIPTYIESIDFSNIYSESAALNCAYISGIISDFVGEETLPTISGRMSTNSFDFSINGDNKSYQIEVRNSQCEIDG